MPKELVSQTRRAATPPITISQLRKDLARISTPDDALDVASRAARAQKVYEAIGRSLAETNEFAEVYLSAYWKFGELVTGIKGGRPKKPLIDKGFPGTDMQRQYGRTLTRAIKAADIPKYVQRATEELETASIAGCIAPYLQRLRDAKERRRQSRRDIDRERLAQLPDSTLGDARFPTIIIDPPWDWGDEGDIDQFGRGRPTYQTLTFEELLELNIEDRSIEDVADVDAHCYLWITNRSLPKGFTLLETWGFRYVTCLTWCKPSIGMGNYFRGSTEHILFGVKGSQPLKVNDVGTWFAWPRGEEHSDKPDAFYEAVESWSPGPFLDVFGRKARDGWRVWPQVKS
jgi:N6-adenosine-specific RNA methylase IME4